MKCGTRNCRWAVVFAVGISASPAAGQTAGGVPEVLGEFPFCEGSAVVWPGGDHLLVGDNEERGSLLAFPFHDGRLDAGDRVERSLGEGVEISDIEAMAKRGRDEVVVFGSHGRNSRCEARDNRRRFLRGRLTTDGWISSGPVVAMRERISCGRLLGDGFGDDGILGAFCERVDAVEQIAEEIGRSGGSDEEREEACEGAQAFNAEGALAVRSAAGEAIWIGLRSPLLPVAGADGGGVRAMAVVLRMRGLDEYAFDAAAAVDFGGGGVRELTVSGGSVFAISGPVADGGGDHQLWTFPIVELQPGARIAPTFVAGLPESAEGLAVVGSTAHVVVDGDQGDVACLEPARYLAVPLGR